jgi:hypothetical protein
VHSVHCVAFSFTRRVDSFRVFVGAPNRHEPWVNQAYYKLKKINNNQLMVMLSLVGIVED